MGKGGEGGRGENNAYYRVIHKFAYIGNVFG